MVSNAGLPVSLLFLEIMDKDIIMSLIYVTHHAKNDIMGLQKLSTLVSLRIPRSLTTVETFRFVLGREEIIVGKRQNALDHFECSPVPHTPVSGSHRVLSQK